MRDELFLEETNLPELWSVKVTQQPDWRGSYQTFFRSDWFHEITGEYIAEVNLVDNFARTFRGYHYSPHSWKLYLCLQGVLHYYLVNWDESHPDYGQWQELTLLPYHGFIKHPRYATGMWAVTDSRLMVAQSQYYNPDKPDQQTITRNQIDVKLISLNKKIIYYPELPMIMSERDMIGEYGAL